MSWRRWPWLEEGALPLSVVLLRLCWLWPWLLVVARWTLPPHMRPFLPLWTVAALMLGGAVTARLLPVDLERPWRTRTLAAGLGLAAMMLTLWRRLERTNYAVWDVRWVAKQAMTLTHWNGVLPLSFAVLLLAAYLWLRGMQDSAAPNHDDIWRAFANGFIALVVLLVAGRIDPAGPPASTERWIVIFFAIGMVGLALAGLRLARGSRNMSAPLPANRYWVASIAAMVAVLLGAGLTLAFVITPDGVARSMGWIRYVLGWIGVALGYALYGLAYVLFLVLTPLINWLEENVGFRLRFNVDRLQEMQQGPMDALEQPSTFALPPAVDESMRWIALLAVLALVAVAFAMALRILRKRGDEEDEEVRETVLSQALLRDQAASLWQRWRDRLWRGQSHPDGPFVSLEGEGAARRRVRAAYQAFLAAMIAQDYPRPRRQTPYQYARSAGAFLSDPSGSVDVLTGKYVAARYDVTEPTANDAAAAETAWSELRDRLASMEQAPRAKKK